MDADEYLRIVVDPDRLGVLGLVAAAPRGLDELEAATTMGRREVVGVVGALAAAGLVAEGPDGWALQREVLREIARSQPTPPEADRQVLYGMTADEQQVLGRFFRGARLTAIPTQRATRRVVLERLALEFEPGIYYPEPEVNELLGAFHDDHASLRRHLVEEGLLSRADGRYWRSGGRVQ